MVMAGALEIVGPPRNGKLTDAALFTKFDDAVSQGFKGVQVEVGAP